jgi:hypothetical protein
VKPVRIAPPASEEFTEAVRWYEEKRVGLGGEFYDASTAFPTRSSTASAAKTSSLSPSHTRADAAATGSNDGSRLRLTNDAKSAARRPASRGASAAFGGQPAQEADRLSRRPQ